MEERTMARPRTPRHVRLLALSAGLAMCLLAGMAGTITTTLAVTCSGNGCNNTSPVTTGCSTGAVTKRTAYIVNTQWPYDNLARIELRYSPTCKTVWSRVTILSSDGAFDTHTSTTRSNSVPPAIPYTVSDYDPDLWEGDSAYSPQIYQPASSSDAYSAKACGSVSNGTVAAGSGCTSYWTGV
jgi:hypothetical protein